MLICILLLVGMAVIFPFFQKNEITIPFVTYSKTFDTAAAQARKEKKNMFVFFGSNRDGNILTFKHKVLSDPEVLKHLENLVYVEIDYEAERLLADKFVVAKPPAFYVLKIDASSLVVTKSRYGFMNKQEIIKFIDESN